MTMIRNGTEVAIEYRITLTDGTEIESNIGDLELTYIQGEHEIFPELEQALEGVTEGEALQITLSPQQAYGAIDDDSFQIVDLDLIPEELQYRGAALAIEDAHGECHHARLARITDLGAVIDFNHPLAGHALVFNILVLSVNDNATLN